MPNATYPADALHAKRDQRQHHTFSVWPFLYCHCRTFPLSTCEALDIQVLSHVLIFWHVSAYATEFVKHAQLPTFGPLQAECHLRLQLKYILSMISCGSGLLLTR